MTGCCVGTLVRSEAGRDKGRLLCVVGMSGEGDFLLSDGKTRRISSPKRKKPQHVTVLDTGSFDHPVLRRLREHAQVFDSDLRRLLAAFRDSEMAERGG